VNGTNEPDGAAWMVLTREPKAWRDGGRSYGLIVDGQQVAKIKRGQRLEHSLTPGEHEIYMKISWCQSPVMKIQVSAGEVVRLHCAPGGSASEALGDVLAGSKTYISLTRLED
jgi:hypothetical protein